MVDDKLLFGRLRETRQPVNAPLNSHPISRFDVMRLAAELVASSGCLLAGEIALLIFGNLEESIGRDFDLTTHCTNIQIVCITVQCRLIKMIFKQRIQFPKALKISVKMFSEPG